MHPEALFTGLPRTPGPRRAPAFLVRGVISLTKDEQNAPCEPPCGRGMVAAWSGKKGSRCLHNNSYEPSSTNMVEDRGRRRSPPELASRSFAPTGAGFPRGPGLFRVPWMSLLVHNNEPPAHWATFPTAPHLENSMAATEPGLPSLALPERRVRGMLRSAASKVMWVGRATAFLVGLAPWGHPSVSGPRASVLGGAAT